ncbi:phosphatase PAP2 family protein [Bifidobacterium thermophilum]|uniref:phosphatase PAP2 family protein n=1 Tax=Bifidobacterium thermophilum TaxID=33905 RepID=UPI0030ADDE56
MDENEQEPLTPQDGQGQSRPSLTFTPFEPQTADAPGFDGPLAFPTQPGPAADAPQTELPGPAADDPAVDDMDRGLAQVDPLAVRPRLSSTVLCIVLGLLLLAASAGVWWLGVRTANGQNFDDEVWALLDGSLPSWLRAMVHILTASSTIIIISVALAVIGVVVAAVRRRWWLLGQLAVFAALCYGSELLKGVLPRPYLQNIGSSASNTAPSGHTILAAASAVVLVCAVPRAWRAVCAAAGSVYALLTALSLVAAKWHRPTDVVMGLLIVGGWALLMLACTRSSGMDGIGTRTASASIQIVGSVMITGGIMITLYGGYLLWQIEPGLSLRAQWTQAGACAATVMLVCGISLLVFGLVLALRQLTASPLTKLGLVGAPPAPPAK